jgi:hypothetical protein
MPLQRLAVILAFVAEYVAEAVDRGVIAHDSIPVIMRDFVPEMPEQGPVRLAHVAALLFPMSVVGFGNVDGDGAVEMAGQDRLPLGDEKVEGEPARISCLDDQRQPEAQQAVEQPMLGQFDLAPEQQIARFGQVRDRAVMAAGKAE